MAEVFEVEDSDFGGVWASWKCVLPIRWVLQTPHILGTGDHAAEPTEADQDQSR